MRRTIYAPVFCVALPALLLTGCGRDRIEETYPNGKPKIIRTYTVFGSIDQGHLRRERTFYFNEHPEIDAHYSRGVLHGSYLTFWHNGQKKSTGQFSHGKRDGEWCFYFNQFALSSKGKFENDLKEGPWVSYWEGGELRSQGQYHEGKDIGTRKEWDAKGVLIMENSCYEANDQGRYQTFHENAAVKEDFTCTRGIPNGLYVRKDPDGMVVEKGAFDAKGRKDGLWETFYPSGAKASTLQFKDGQQQDSAYSWDEKGRLRERSFLSEGTGEHLLFDSLGHVLERRRLLKGKPEGESWTYFPSGKNRALTVYQNGLPTEMKKWHENGKIFATGLFKDGKREGEWKQWDEKGVIMQVTHYEKGVMHGDQLFYDEHGKLTRTQRYEHGYPAVGKIPANLMKQGVSGGTKDSSATLDAATRDSLEIRAPGSAASGH